MNHNELCDLTAWFCENIAFGHSDLDHYAELAKRPVEKILEELRQHHLACMCGSMSVFMASKASMAGGTIYGLNFGQPGGPASHVVTVAQNEFGLTIYDPSFGRYLESAGSSTPASIETMIRSIEAGQQNSLRWHYVTDQRLYRTEITRLVDLQRIDPDLALVKRTDETVVVRLNPRRLADWMGQYIYNWMWCRYRRVRPFDEYRIPLSTSGEQVIVDVGIQLAALEAKLRKRHRYIASTLSYFYDLKTSPVR